MRSQFVMGLVLVSFLSVAKASVSEKSENFHSKFESEESLPLQISEKTEKKGVANSVPLLLAGVFLFVGLGTGSWLLLKSKKKNASKLSREYLIENLSYSSVGPKAGVSLLKIGSEFVLVGVTQHQITFLSHLPKLEAQYAEEAALERQAFKKVVEQEVSKVGRGRSLEA